MLYLLPWVSWDSWPSFPLFNYCCFGFLVSLQCLRKPLRSLWQGPSGCASVREDERSVWIFTPTACFYRLKTACRRNMHPNSPKFKSMPVSHFIWLQNFWLVITSRLFVQAQPHLFHCFYLRVGQVRHLHCPLLTARMDENNHDTTNRGET